MSFSKDSNVALCRSSELRRTAGDVGIVVKVKLEGKSYRGGAAVGHAPFGLPLFGIFGIVPTPSR